MIETILKTLKEALQISLLVAVMMIVVDLLNVLTKKKRERFLKTPEDTCSTF